ncbi:hypothetical protein V8F06_010025 [Rhypophila decipiens]
MAVTNTAAGNQTPRLLVRAWYNSSVLGVHQRLNIELVNSLPGAVEVLENKSLPGTIEVPENESLPGAVEVPEIEYEPIPMARMGVWAITPRMYSDDTPRNECSGFTCLEIDLSYDPPTSPRSRTGPREAARTLFYDSDGLTELISKFMESKKKKPMYFTIHPDPAWWKKSGLPQDFKLEYTFVKFEHSLSLSLKPVALTTIPRTSLAYEMGSQLGSSAKEIGVAVGDICSKILALSAEVQQGASPAKLLDFVHNAIETAKVPSLDDAFKSSKLETTEAIKRSWTGMLVSAACFRRLSSGMKGTLGALSGDGHVLNSTLHALVTDMTVARLLFGEYESEVEKLCKLLKEKYNDDPSLIRTFWKISLTICGVAAVAGLGVATCGIGALVVPAAVGGTSLAASGVGLYYDSTKRGTKENNVVTLDENVVKMRNTLHEAQMAVALMFCHQVLQVPVEALANPQERDEILENLGIDVYHIGQDDREGEGFGKKLVQNRLENFLKAYEAVGRKQNEIADDLKIKVGSEPKLVLPEAVMMHSYPGVKSITVK